MFTSTLHYNSMSNWHSSNSNSERAILHKYTSFQTLIQRQTPVISQRAIYVVKQI